MTTRGWLVITIVLGIVIAGLLFALVTLPAPASNPPPIATSTAPAAATARPTPLQPLSARVVLTSPAQGASVAHTFDVVGQAPGGWFFEAQFPIQVRDADDNVLGRATGSAQGDWQTSGLVAFKATMHVDDSYHGPADLILMKDNPSGLPENDDAVTMPIVIQ